MRPEKEHMVDAALLLAEHHGASSIMVTMTPGTNGSGFDVVTLAKQTSLASHYQHAEAVYLSQLRALMRKGADWLDDDNLERFWRVRFLLERRDLHSARLADKRRGT